MKRPCTYDIKGKSEFFARFESAAGVKSAAKASSGGRVQRMRGVDAARGPEILFGFIEERDGITFFYGDFSGRERVVFKYDCILFSRRSLCLRRRLL